MQNSVASPGSLRRRVFIDPVRMSELEGRIKDPPVLLSRWAGRSSCCIYRVPRILSKINEKAYQPSIVSIGPYYHGDPRFEMIQEHKWRFLCDLLARAESYQVVVSIQDLFEAISLKEESIRESYSEALNFDSRELIEMAVLDGCFIIELFCKVARLGKLDSAEHDEPLLNVAWVLPFLMRDLLRLENQIPFFVLKDLFDLCVGSNFNTLVKLALLFFNDMVQRPVKVLKKYYNCEGKHLLDLFLQTYLPPSQEDLRFPSLEDLRSPSEFLRLIQSARKLHLAGVKFEPLKTERFLDIEFKNGVLKIPILTIDDFTSSLFLNFVAYEQCYSHCSKYITTYMTFMGCLINTPTDAGFLCDRKIVESYFGTDDEVARFFNNVGKDVAFDIQKCYLSRVFTEVDEYCQNGWHIRWAEFKHTYFDSPWSFMSALAAMVLLILTVIQPFFAVYAYFRPLKNNQ